jgi:plasmid maintenance system antidote protein VapI
MMNKADINRRFIAAIESLLKDKGLTKTKVAESLGIKPAKFSEILNNRMNAGVDAIADLCDQYSFSAEWILTGQGTMLKVGPIKGRSKPGIVVAPLPDFPLTSDGVCQMFLEIMRDKDLRFSEQAEEIGRLKAKIEELERNRGVDVGDVKSSGIANAG